MKKSLILVMVMVVTLIGAQVSWADAIPLESEGGNPWIWEAINYVFESVGSPLAVPLTSNIDAEAYKVNTANSYWTDLGGGVAGNFAAIGITAENHNALGVYLLGDPSGSKLQVIDPQWGYGYLNTNSANPSDTLFSQDGSFPGGINPYSSGEVFGFYLNSNGAFYYSDPDLNGSLEDHMLAYYLPELNETSLGIDTDGDGYWDMDVEFTAQTYLLAFEDMPLGNSDLDYNDTIFLVARVAPSTIPEPMSMMLLGSGLLGLVGLRRKVA